MIDALGALASDVAPMLVLGSTVLLAVGGVAVALSRLPTHQQRLAELAVGGTMLWLVLAVTPLPRWSIAGPPPAVDAARAEAGDAEPRHAGVGEVAASPVVSSTSHSPATPRRMESAAVIEPVADAHRRGEVHLAGHGADASWTFAGAASDEVGRTTMPTEASPGDQGRRLHPWSVIAAVYLVGAALLLLRLVFAIVGVRRLLRRSRLASPPLIALVETLARELGIAMPRVCVGAAGSPLCIGVRRSTIVLPADLAVLPLPAELASVLRHELAHVRRRDGARRLLLALAAPLLWPQPLFWWLRSRAFLAAELIADGEATSGSSPLGYARTLLALSSRNAGAVPVAISISAPRSHLHRRITMLMNDHVSLVTRDSRRARFAQRGAAAVLVVAAAAVFGVRPAAAQEPEEPHRMRQLEEERARLHNEIDVLRQELDELRAMVKAQSRTDRRRNDGEAEDQAAPAERNREALRALGYVGQPAPDADVETQRALERVRRAQDEDRRAMAGQAPAAPRSGGDGLRPGDVLLEVDGVPVHSVAEAIEIARQLDPDGTGPPSITVLRRGSGDGPPPTATEGAPRNGDGVADLALALIDARGDLQRARLSLDAHTAAQERGTVDSLTVARAKIDVDVAQQRTKMLQQLLTGEAQALEMQMVYLQHELGAGPGEGDVHFGADSLRRQAELRRLQVQLDTVHDLLR